MVDFSNKNILVLIWILEILENEVIKDRIFIFDDCNYYVCLRFFLGRVVELIFVFLFNFF